MSSMFADQLVLALEELPSLPQVLSELIEAIDHDNVDQHCITMRIAQDQILTSKTLRLANSSFYGLSYRVNSLSDAVFILGFRSLRTLVTSAAIANLLHRFVLDRKDVDYFFEHSISVAIFAKLLAAHVCANQEQAFTTGLIHDLGKLALVTKFPDEYAEVTHYQKEHACARYEAENAVLSTSHASIGAMLACKWRFPLEMQQAVSAHHDPITAETSELSILMTVANIFAKVRGSDEERIHMLRESGYVWQRMELNEELCKSMFATEKQQFAEISQILLSH
ncbi:HDOD domain-containing protein [Undibacterium rugosum]|uniref:HDOD domain-containing protein n=1 Tax=Undibacterium rugosum TaxID=2762291 RepID=UPI001B82C0EC|nr:HDOD domain-containing protein [Undibacterium rugosum]MBR7778709.1 HDOD domain-containing protein [Undibacterium rugosum]